MSKAINRVEHVTAVNQSFNQTLFIKHLPNKSECNAECFACDLRNMVL